MPSDEGPAYEIGYGKPPRHTQFRPGQSGNPRGRPKGAKNLSTLVHEALNRPVVAVENGQRRKISKREAIITQLVNQSTQGGLKAIQLLLGVAQEVERRSEVERAETDFDTADEKVIEELRAQFSKGETR